MDSYKRNIKTSQRLEYGIYQFLDHFIGRGRVSRLLRKRRNVFYKNLEKTLEKSGQGNAIEIERRTNLSLKEFRNTYLKKGIPVVLEGAAKDWGCVKKWSLEYFKELHGTDDVVMPDEKDVKNFEIMTLANVIDTIQEGGKRYYRFYPLLTKHPEHISDFDHKWLKERKNKFTWIEAFRVFIGGKDTTTKLHMENLCNLFVQAHGEKKWILYPPYYSSIMDPYPVRNVYRTPPPKIEKGVFDPFNPNYEAPYNLYKYIDHFETILKPGDVLWIPTFYWHTVVNLSNSIGMGYRWFNPFLSFKIAPLYMFLDFFATKPPIWELVKLSKEDVNVLLVAEKGKLDKYRRVMKERKEMKDVKLSETKI